MLQLEAKPEVSALQGAPGVPAMPLVRLSPP